QVRSAVSACGAGLRARGYGRGPASRRSQGTLREDARSRGVLSDAQRDRPRLGTHHRVGRAGRRRPERCLSVPHRQGGGRPMSSAIEAAALESRSERSAWALWRRQARAIFRLESRKCLFGKRAIVVYLLAALPIVPTAFLALFPVTAKILLDEGRANELY